MNQAILDAFVHPHHLVVDAPVRLGGAVADSGHRRAALDDGAMEIEQQVAGHPVGGFALIGGRLDDAVFQRQLAQVGG